MRLPQRSWSRWKATASEWVAVYTRIGTVTSPTARVPVSRARGGMGRRYAVYQEGGDRGGAAARIANPHRPPETAPADVGAARNPASAWAGLSTGKWAASQCSV